MIIENSVATNPYSDDNLKFRKAYIRVRLAALKQEREELLAERERIDQARGTVRKPNSSAAENSAGH